MTYLGSDYYPAWLDNLAADVTLEAAAMDGTAHGTENVHSIVVAAKTLYENQDFSFAGPYGNNGFLEEYTCTVRGKPFGVVVVVGFNAAGQTQRIVVNHRPRSSLLFFSRLMLEKFADTPLALSTGKVHRKGRDTSCPLTRLSSTSPTSPSDVARHPALGRRPDFRPSLDASRWRRNNV